jgi:predicted transcriptional regulator
MSSGEIFVIFVIPAVGVIVAYAAMRANEWAIQRDERKAGK